MTVGEIYMENTYNTTGIVNRLLETFRNFGYKPQYWYDDNYHKGKIIDWKTNEILARIHPPSDESSKDHVGYKIARRMEILVDDKKIEDLITYFCVLTKKTHGPEVYMGVITPEKRSESAI